jgi:hypothetical protein
LKISKSSASSPEPSFSSSSSSSSSSCNFNSKHHAEEKGKKGCPGNYMRAVKMGKKEISRLRV